MGWAHFIPPCQCSHRNNVGTVPQSQAVILEIRADCYQPLSLPCASSHPVPLLAFITFLHLFVTTFALSLWQEALLGPCSSMWGRWVMPAVGSGPWRVWLRITTLAAHPISLFDYVTLNISQRRIRTFLVIAKQQNDKDAWALPIKSCIFSLWRFTPRLSQWTGGKAKQRLLKAYV